MCTIKETAEYIQPLFVFCLNRRCLMFVRSVVVATESRSSIDRVERLDDASGTRSTRVR
jgi:hypothetical protein